MARVTIYKNSILATLISLLGYCLVIGGVVVAFNGEIAMGIVFALIGFGFAVWASAISESKKFRTWKKQLAASGLVPAIQSSVQTAIQVYNTYPGTKTLEYIRTLNPEAAKIISEHLASKKKNA